jgi:hypothetical protein
MADPDESSPGHRMDLGSIAHRHGPTTPEPGQASEEARPDALIAGTLCLMSCFAQHPLPAYAARIADNLMQLGTQDALTAEFRAACRRIAERWVALEADARVRCAGGAAVRDGRSLQ